MKNLYTYKEIKDKIKSNDYNAEMLLQHLLLRYEEIEKELNHTLGQVEGYKEANEMITKIHVDTIRDLLPWEKGTE